MGCLWLQCCFFLWLNPFFNILLQFYFGWNIGQLLELLVDLILITNKLSRQVIVKIILNLLQPLDFGLCLSHIWLFLRWYSYLVAVLIFGKWFCKWISDLVNLLPVCESNRVIQLIGNSSWLLPLVVGRASLTPGRCLINITLNCSLVISSKLWASKTSAEPCLVWLVILLHLLR